MPSLTLGTESIALPPGTHTLGGRAADALRLGALASHPAVAVIIVTSDGRALIRRTTAAVVVRLNGEPLGIAAAELRHAATIDFKGLRLTYDQWSSAEAVHIAADDQSAAPHAVAGEPTSAPRLVASSIGVRTPCGHNADTVMPRSPYVIASHSAKASAACLVTA